MDLHHFCQIRMLFLSVADPHHDDADRDPACHFDADPDLAYHFDAHPGPTFYIVADPVLDPHSSFQIQAQNFEKVLIYVCSYSIHFGLSSALQIDADPDPTFQFNLDPDPNHCSSWAP
jgi:hypothetical protein